MSTGVDRGPGVLELTVHYGNGGPDKKRLYQRGDVETSKVGRCILTSNRKRKRRTGPWMEGFNGM